MPYKDKNKRNENTRKYKALNKEKLLERRRELYRLKNKDKITNKKVLSEEEKKLNKAKDDKRYREKYGDKIKVQKKQYYQKNKKIINQKNLLKLKTDPQKKIAHSIRCRMYQALKGKRKPDSSIKKLGCSLSDFIIYIENKFTSEMSWDNHGSYWHLDHIKPLALFNLEDKTEFEIACHYSNYQPLKAIDNLSKNKYYDPKCE